jgi:hypothetical protein
MGRSRMLTGLWVVALALASAAATFGVLFLVEGGAGVRAQTVRVDGTDGATGDLDALDREGDAPPAEPSSPPPGHTSVLADGVEFYSVERYSVLERDGTLEPAEGEVLAEDHRYQVILGEERLDADEVYSVDVEHQEPSGDDPASWVVHIRFNDAARLVSSTADLGCLSRPENMLAIASGTSLFTVAEVPRTLCDVGFDRGQIDWYTDYDGTAKTSEEAEAEARLLAAQMLGTAAADAEAPATDG